jgi:hypothetical protein
MDDMDDTGGEWEWKVFPAMREMENGMRCDVCGEFMNTPMTVVACQHTYCSMCIRRQITDNKRSDGKKGRRRREGSVCVWGGGSRTS